MLAILAFGFSLIGTFIVRSGVLTSVHAFANDPERGVFILMILGFFVGGGLTLFALRSNVLTSRGVFGVISRESALVANNVLLAIGCFVVFVGTVWPLVAELFFDRRLSVGPPFFDAAFTPFMVGLAIVLPIGSHMPWKRAQLGKASRAMIPAAFVGLACLGLLFVMQTGQSLLGPIGLALGAWIITGALLDLWKKKGTLGVSRLLRLPRAEWGKAIAHIGFGITVMGVAGLTAWKVEDIRVMNIGDTARLGQYELTLQQVEDFQGPNFVSETATFDVRRAGGAPSLIQAEKRFYPVAQMPTTEAGIRNGALRDIYITIGASQPGGGWAVRSFIKPLANWIWLGSIVMALGAMVSLTDRRYRVGVGAQKQDEAA